MKKIALLHISFLLTLGSMAQIEVDNKLIFTSPDSSQRTITGLAHVTDTSALTPVVSYSRNKWLYTPVSGDDSLFGMLPVNVSLNEGFAFWFSSSQHSASNPIIAFNASPYYPIQDANGILDSNCLKQNEMVLVVYDGTAFIDVFNDYKICPNGFVDVTDNYCIEVNENATANFWDAIAACRNKNAELCTWGEWYYACQKSGLGLNNMNNNWEWANSANNHANAALILGNTGCQDASESNTQIVTDHLYRCCYHKK